MKNIKKYKDITKALFSGEVISRYALLEDGTLSENEDFDSFFNSPGSDEDIHISNMKKILKNIGLKIESTQIDGKLIDSVQSVSIETTSLLNIKDSKKMKTEDLGKFLTFCFTNKDLLRQSHIFLAKELDVRTIKSLSKLIIQDEKKNYFYVPGLTLRWAETLLKEIEKV